MPMRRGLVLALAVTLAATPGCADLLDTDEDVDGEPPPGEERRESCTAQTFPASDEGEVAFIECDANVPGRDDQDADCPRPDDAEATASADLDGGAIRVLVEDAGGEALIDERLEDTGGEPRNLTVPEGGEAGAWTLTVERLEGFDGSFRAELYCPN